MTQMVAMTMVAGQFDDASSSSDEADIPVERVATASPVVAPSSFRRTVVPPIVVGAPSRSSSSKTNIKSIEKSLVPAKETYAEEEKNYSYNNINDEEDEDVDNDYLDDDEYTLMTSRTTTTVSHKVANRLQQMQDLECTQRTLHTDRNDRSTLEQVLDPRTRYILFKMLQSNVLSKLEGCLSTGKEANVYYALAGAHSYTSINNSGTNNEATDSSSSSIITEYALKVYKTSILIFRDRDKYVSGEYRYRNGYCKSNPRKMIALWAEKELRNYRRIHQAGIPCPRPLAIQQHVLVLEFLGTDGWPAPRLKDLPTLYHPSRYVDLYIQCLLLLRHMYQRCQLVHGDFSEYNLLYHRDRLYVIDVSQSVETQHPAAYDFLRLDIRNISDYFAKQLSSSSSSDRSLLTTRQCFDFIVNAALDDGDEPTDDEDAERRYLDRLLLQQRTAPVLEDPIFLQTYLPRNLHEIQLPSDRARRSTSDNTHSAAKDDSMSYEAQAVAQMTVNEAIPAVKERPSASSKSEDSPSSDENDSDDEDELSRPSRSPRSPEELQLERQLRKEERRRNKKLVKEQQSVKRQEKKKKKKKG